MTAAVKMFMACRQFLTLVRKGSIEYDPPHTQGFKVEKRMPQLKAIYSLLTEGWVTEKGQRCMFRSLAHCAARNPGILKLREDMGLDTWKGVWDNLVLVWCCPYLCAWGVLVLPILVHGDLYAWGPCDQILCTLKAPTRTLKW